MEQAEIIDTFWTYHVLTATQKAYVFDAPLDVQTPTTSSVDVVNT